MKKDVIPDADCTVEEDLVRKISSLNSKIYLATDELEKGLKAADALDEPSERAVMYRDNVIVNLEKVRTYVDELETVVDKQYWPYPSYGEILFSVQ